MRKQNQKWQWARIARGALLAAGLALLLLGGQRVRAASGDLDAEELGQRGHNPNPELFRPESHPFGLAMDTWAESWWRWELSIPAAQNPILTQDFIQLMQQRRPNGIATRIARDFPASFTADRDFRTAPRPRRQAARDGEA